MSARRIVQRRAWRSDCPPIFDRAAKAARAYNLRGLKAPERKSWREWLGLSRHAARSEVRS